MKPIVKEKTPGSEIPYREVSTAFRVLHLIPADDSIEIEQDAAGVCYIKASGGSVSDLVAGYNISIRRTPEGKTVISAVNTAADIAAGQNITIDIDPETGTAIINSIIDGPTNEHYKGVFDTPEDLIAFDVNPEQGDYGMVKRIVFSDGGETSWNGQYKYCFYINGAWTVVDQMLTFTDDVELLQQFYSVGGSSPVIYLHKIAQTGSFRDLRDVPIVATPLVTIEGNTVTAECATEGAEIWYSTDGSMPHVNGMKYTRPITASGATTYRFVGIKNGMINSEEAVVSADYSLEAPTIDLDWHDGTVSMANSNGAGTIYYTTDGSTPTDQSTAYSEPFVITEATTFKLVVIDSGTASPVTVQRYEQADNVGRFSIGANMINGTATIAFTQPESGEAHYEMGDETPTFSSPLSEGTISFPYYDEENNPRYYSVRVFAPGYVPSTVAQSTPNGKQKPTAPAISYDAETGLVTIGRVGETQSIQLGSAIRSYGSAIRYTLDGSEPTADSLVYSEPFKLEINATVKAVLIAYGEHYSNVTSLDIALLLPPTATYDGVTATLTIHNPNNVASSIYYTYNGSDPTVNGILYEQPLRTRNYTFRMVVKLDDSDVFSQEAVITIERAEPPRISFRGTNGNPVDFSTGVYKVLMVNPNTRGFITYTTDGTSPNADSTVYTTDFDANYFDGVVIYQAVVFNREKFQSTLARASNGADSVDAPLVNYNEQTRQLTIAPVGNTTDIPLQTNTNVPEVGSRIWYTLDGSIPSRANGTLYTGPVTVPDGVYVIKAVIDCYSRYTSDVVEYAMDMNIGISGLKSTLIIEAPDGADVYFTTDGSTPTRESGTHYTGPGIITAPACQNTVVVKAAYWLGDVQSGVVEAAFDNAVQNTISLSSNVEKETGLNTVYVDVSDPVTVFYDYGMEPSLENASAASGNTFDIPYYNWKPEHANVYMCREGYVSAYGFTVSGYNKTPDIPAVGYDDSLLTAEIHYATGSNDWGIPVKTSMADPLLGGRIYYTLDGSTPTPETGTLYTGQIQLQKGDVLKFMTQLYGQFNSGVGVQNVYVPESALSDDDVAIVVKNNTTGELRYAPYTAVESSAIENGGYTLKPFLQFTRGKNGKPVFMHKDQTGGMWAEFNRYRLACDTSAPGGFDWAVTINGTAKSGSVSWQAGDTLDSILAQLTPQGVDTYLVFAHMEDEQFIRITQGGYSNSTFTLSNNTGATLTDLSFYTKIGDVQQTETHRTWQAMDVNDMFPSLGFLASNTVQYAVNGYNLSYMCGGNETRYKAYYRTNGASSYLAENAVSNRMSEAAFNAMDGSGNVDAQALYDKYDGSWAAYMEASMVAIDDANANGIEYQSYDNGDTQTMALASVATMDFDGSYIPAFPCAANCQSITDTDVANGKFNMNTEHEFAVFMRDAKLDAVNAAFDILIAAGMTVTKLSRTAYYYWSVARYYSDNAWFYYADIGILNGHRLSSDFSARPLAYPVNS